MWTVSRLASGMSTAWNWTPLSIREEINRTLRETVELDDDEGRLVALAERQGGGELRPIILSAALDFLELSEELAALAGDV